MNIALAARRSAVRYRSAPAVFQGDRSISWIELDERSSRLANLLTDGLGLERGSRVALLAPNRLEVVEVLVGVAKAAMTYVGLNFRLGERELGQIFANAEPRALIVAAELRGLGEQVAAEHGIPVIDLDDAGPEGYAALLARAAPDAPPALRSVASTDDFAIVYTSGTTGTPKGVWFDHGRVLQHATVAALEYEIDRASRYLISIPHNSSINIAILPCLVRGGAIGFLDSRGFDAGAFAAEVAAQSATHAYLVPTQLYRLLDQVGSPEQLSSMVTLGYGAAPMSPDKAGELVARFGPIFNQLYGMAEIASIGTMLRKEDHVAALAGRPHLLRSAGQPSYAVDVRVVGADGADVAPGERGEVLFAGPHVMKGYFADPERTVAAMVDGWVHSGDIAEVDDEGYLYIVDRKKDLIIRGGYNIAPAEVEGVLHRHPDVLEVGVIGVPDPEWGEAILAVVALRPGAEVGAADLLGWVEADRSLGTVKRPSRIELVDELPKNAVGKVEKSALRSRYWTGERRV